MELELKAAWAEATRATGEILEEIDGSLEPEREWRMDVSNDAGQPLFSLRLMPETYVERTQAEKQLERLVLNAYHPRTIKGANVVTKLSRAAQGCACLSLKHMKLFALTVTAAGHAQCQSVFEVPKKHRVCNPLKSFRSRSSAG
jgi:hypothetical protein